MGQSLSSASPPSRAPSTLNPPQTIGSSASSSNLPLEQPVSIGSQDVQSASTVLSADAPPVPANPLANINRYNLEGPSRIALAFMTSFSVGAILGSAYGARTSALRFRAENSHRFPTTQANWLLYHKAKNNYVILEGMKEGARMGFRIAPWATLFFGVEEAVDVARWEDVPEEQVSMGRWRISRTADGKGYGGRYRDFWSTTVAGLSTAGVYGLWHRLEIDAWGRVAKQGLFVGLGLGLAEDAVYLLRGQRLAYVDYVKGLFGRGEREAVGNK